MKHCRIRWSQTLPMTRYGVVCKSCLWISIFRQLSQSFVIHTIEMSIPSPAAEGKMAGDALRLVLIGITGSKRLLKYSNKPCNYSFSLSKIIKYDDWTLLSHIMHECCVSSRHPTADYNHLVNHIGQHTDVTEFLTNRTTPFPTLFWNDIKINKTYAKIIWNLAKLHFCFARLDKCMFAYTFQASVRITNAH